MLGDNILFRGVVNGKRRRERIKFSPSLFVPTQKQSKHKTIYGENLTEIPFEGIKDAREFISKYEGVSNFPIYGVQSFEYAYIAKEYPGELVWDTNQIYVANIDLEWGSEHGFAKPENPTEPITAITMIMKGKTQAFGCMDFIVPEGVKYYKCHDERDLIQTFLDVWTNDYPDVITGWYTALADIPYLINRIIRVFDEATAKKLSPWGHIRKKETFLHGSDKAHVTYSILGIASLDYYELFRKFDPKGTAQESYKLDYICNVILQEKKLDYKEYGTLHRLYVDNPQKFMEYNIKDVQLVQKLDKKLHILDLAYKLAFDSRSNFEDVFKQTRMWDNIVNNFLLKENVIICPKRHMVKSEFMGAYVKEPQLGKHRWPVSFDLTSLYPHLMMQYNISPECLVSPKTINNDPELREIVGQNINVQSLLHKEIDTDKLKRNQVTLTPNNQLFRTDIEGFLPRILIKMFNDRKMYKDKMLVCEKQIEAFKKEGRPDYQELENQKAMFKVFETSIKVCINSCYGALGSEYFRYFDVKMAEAVTSSGQLAILWIQKHVNELMNAILGTNDVDYVVASDTDSIYLVLSELVNKVFDKTEKLSVLETNKIVDFIDKACKTKIQPFIDLRYKELAEYTGAYAQKMLMKREKICDIGICISGKNYIWNVWDKEGVRYEKPKPSIVGLSMIKSSTPEVCRKKLREIVPLILTDQEPLLQQYVADFKREFMNLPLEEIACPGGMNGLIKQADKKTIYKKGTNIACKGSLLYNHHVKLNDLQKTYQLINDGEKIKYLCLKLPNPIKDDVIAFPINLPSELDLDRYVDKEHQFDKVFLAPLKAILIVIDWSHEKRNSLW